MTSKYILHIPHDSTDIPAAYRDDLLLSDKELARELLYMTDMYTDDLYQLDGAERLRFPVSRLILDPERFDDDAQEPMAARGMGVIYTITSQLGKLREKPSNTKRKELLDRYYYPHHKALTDMVDAAVAAHGECLIFDCHSFPGTALPYELKGPDEYRPEFCIGSDGFHTPPELTKGLLDFFEGKGYTVGENIPFGGALTPLKHYGADKRVKSVMFEIRRDLYMDQDTGEKTPRYSQIKQDVCDAMEMAKKYI